MMMILPKSKVIDIKNKYISMIDSTRGLVLNKPNADTEKEMFTKKPATIFTGNFNGEICITVHECIEYYVLSDAEYKELLKEGVFNLYFSGNDKLVSINLEMLGKAILKRESFLIRNKDLLLVGVITSAISLLFSLLNLLT